MSFFFFLLGACVGSFLNVCIYRWPRGFSVISPRSYCPACKKAIPWYVNIPILSFILLRGKAQCCKAKLPWRDFAVEVLSAIFFVLNFQAYEGVSGVLNLIFFGCLVIASGIDLDFMVIPDALSLGGLVGAIGIGFANPLLHTPMLGLGGLASSVYGGFSALASASFGAGFLLLIAFAAEKILDQEAIGMGDIKLMAFIGAFCGWQGTLFSIFIGSMLGSVILLPLITLQKLKGKKIHGQTQWAEQCRLDPSLQALDASRLRVPFGPWLSLAALIYILFFKFKVPSSMFLY